MARSFQVEVSVSWLTLFKPNWHTKNSLKQRFQNVGRRKYFVTNQILSDWGLEEIFSPGGKRLEDELWRTCGKTQIVLFEVLEPNCLNDDQLSLRSENCRRPWCDSSIAWKAMIPWSRCEGRRKCNSMQIQLWAALSKAQPICASFYTHDLRNGLHFN